MERKDGKEILRRLFRNLGHNEELARETLVSLLAGYEPPEALEDSFISSRAVSIAEAVRRTIEEVLKENGIEAGLKTVIEQERFNRAGVLIYDADKRVVLVDEAELEDVSEAYGEVENLASALASIWNRAVGTLETFYGVKVPPVEQDTVIECAHEVEEMFGIDNDNSPSP